MMRQFHAAKKKHPNALLFFRMGDFYEMFFEDAKIASKELGLSLVARDKAKKVPMAGVPVKSMEGYLTRLVRAGHSVAICEQLQDPRDAKGIVERGVVRVVSPGTLVDESSLIGSEPLFVLAVDIDHGDGLGLAWADLSTGAFRCSQCSVDEFIEEVSRIQPAEVLLPEFNSSEEGASFELAQRLQSLLAESDIPVSWRMPWNFDAKNGHRDLCKQLKVSTLEAYGIEDSPQIISACGGLLDFLHDTQKSAVDQLRELSLHRAHQHLLLDQATRRTLEIVTNQRDGSRQGTLLATIDRSGTAMGARLLREWLLEPLIDANAIISRHDAVDELVVNTNARKSLASTLSGMSDLERLAAKLASGRSGPRDINALASALERVPELLEQLVGLNAAQLCALRDDLDPHVALVREIRTALSETPPLLIKEGGLIRDSFNPEVDELRGLAQGGKDYLAAMQQRESERLGVAVKIGFNRVFGYYIELTSSVVGKAPEDYIRKQTLKNAERYITPELKEYEHKVLGAEEKLKDIEYELFEKLRSEVLGHAQSVAKCAQAIASLDVLQSLSTIAVEKRLVRPQFIEASAGSCGVLSIKEGRHPVVEDALLGQAFVPNDTTLGDDCNKRLAIITGPNMSGKSTYLRQTALVVLLAQMGSFVPAESVEMTLVDRIFTRLGSGDDISRGQSTFMVEMVETANILRNASNRSLLLLDEVGRGTSTFDGLAIAWAVCEYTHDKLQARCLFATHYHQLTDLADKLSAGVNLNVAVREWGEEIVFLHRIEEGGTDRSYGIHVAQLAGLPREVLQRSQEILQRLENDEEGLSRKILHGQSKNVPAAEQVAVVQPSLFDFVKNNDGDSALLSELENLNLNELPPIEAWQILDRVLRAIKK